MLNVVMLCAAMQSVIMLSVVVPFIQPFLTFMNKEEPKWSSLCLPCLSFLVTFGYPKNISRTDTLAYFDAALVTKEKGFNDSDSWILYCKTYYGSNCYCISKS